MGERRSPLEGLVITMNESNNTLQVSVWLMPENLAAGSLSESIKDLAQKFSSPDFAPHMTLYSTKIPAENLIQVKENLKNRVKDFKSLTLNVLGVGQTERLFKSLFFQLQNSKELNGLYQIVKSLLSKYGNYDIDPHISLLYKEGLSAEEKTKSIEDIEFASEIEFDRVAIKVSGPNDDFGKEINKWTFEVLN